MSHLSNFKAALIKAGFDAAIIGGKINQRYLSGFDFDDGYVLVTKGASYLLTDFRYIEAAKQQADPDLCVEMFSRGGERMMLAGMLSDNRCNCVAIEEDDLSYGDFLNFQTYFSGCELKSGASKILRELRVCKDVFELQTIARAQEITDAAFAHILKVMKPDMTEVEVAMELEYFMRRNGADSIAFDTVAVSGANSSRPHGVPRRCKLEKGFLTMDFGAAIGGYCSDMTRTVVIGRADAEMKRLYNTVLTAQKAALDAAVEGIGCRALDTIARDIIEGAGYKDCFGHSLGHGVGLLIHESPNLSPRADDDSVLCRGHVVTVEPGIYIEGKYGCRIEDMICVKPDGSVYDFTRSPKELIELF